MKLFTFWVSLALFALGVTSLSADTGVVLASFKNSGFSYGYEGWKDLGSHQSLGADSVHISGPAAGGAGLFLDKLQDISGSKVLNVKIKRMAIGNHSDILIKIFDAKGKSIDWTIKASDIPSDKLGVIALPIDPKAAIDLEEIKQIQIQGTFNPSAQVEIDLASVVSG